MKISFFFFKIQNFHKISKVSKISYYLKKKNQNDKIFKKFQKFHKIKSKIEPYVIKQLLHLNEINMRFYGAEYNNIERVVM